MKLKRSILLSFGLMILVSTSAIAQSNAKVIAVINKASWCHTCEKNGERAMEAFNKSNSEGIVKFVANDLTSKESASKSLKKIKELGLEKAMASHKSTGLVFFFNADSKELITKISVAKSDEELAKAVNSAKKNI